MTTTAVAPEMSQADRLAHDFASYVRQPQKILAESPAGHPRGHLPAEEQAEAFRKAGIPATVVQDLPGDRFLVLASDEEGQR